MKPLVIYHADCTDGYGAAFAAWMKLGDGAEYLPMHYHGLDNVNDLSFRGREIYILDFSFDRPIMELLFQHASRVVWLDHHKTAFEMWCGKYEKGMVFEPTPGTRQGKENYVHLNDNKSGALLAWEYFHPGTEVPLLIRHIDDRDRWQFKMEGSRELHAALSSVKPWSFERWGHWCGTSRGLSFDTQNDWRRFLAEGSAILRAQEQHVKSMVKQARECEIETTTTFEQPQGHEFQDELLGFSGLAVNASLHQSEVGHELADKSGTYGLVWYLDAEGKVRCSLRSNGDYDVSAIARAFGGGGHKSASGFTIDVQTLLGWLK